jgi:hypothetical protein
MRRLIFINMLAITSVILAACGGASTPTDTSAAKPVNIKVESNPNPAMMGDAELVFTITGPDGDPIEGANVDVSADHTDMTGMGMNGPATDQGGGKYAINATFPHSGNWKLTVYVRKDGLDYKEDIEFTVQ